MNKIRDAFKTDPIDRDALAVLRLALNEKLETIKVLDAEVLDLIDVEGEIAAEIAEADEYKEQIYTELNRISIAVRVPAASTAVSAPPTAAPTTATPLSRVRLPKLQLRSFNGDVTKWTSFWQSFEAAVHKNDDISNVEKFNYLNSLLERSARDAVVGLVLTEANYSQAIEILKKRFGSKQQIVN